MSGFLPRAIARRSPARLRPVGLLAGCVAVGLLAGCAGGAPAQTSGTSASRTAPDVSAPVRHVQGRGGQLDVGDGYVTEPASPDVAAAYLTVENHGGTAVRLTAVRSAVAADVMPMTEASSGGVGTMAPLTDVVVPAHSTYRFRPGAAHLMLEHPHPVPATGDTVPLTLTFSPGGTVITISVPVMQIGAAGPGSNASMPPG